MFKKNTFWIGDVCQEQGIARNRCASRTTVFLLNDLTELVNGQHPTTYIQKGAHNGSHHIAEEPVCCDGELPGGYAFLSRDSAIHASMMALAAHSVDGGDLFPTGMHDAAVVGLHICVELGEGSEVNVVKEGLSCLIHLVKIKGLRKPVGIRLKG